MTDQDPKNPSIVEEVEVAGRDAIARIQDLLEEGNIRRLIIKNEEGRILIEVPLTVGAAVGVGAIAFAPVLAAVGAAVGFLTKLRIEIIRDGSKPKNGE
jgi:hypothetical protein